MMKKQLKLSDNAKHWAKATLLALLAMALIFVIFSIIYFFAPGQSSPG
jgi:hypothetical protein